METAVKTLKDEVLTSLLSSENAGLFEAVRLEIYMLEKHGLTVKEFFEQHWKEEQDLNDFFNGAVKEAKLYLTEWKSTRNQSTAKNG